MRFCNFCTLATTLLFALCSGPAGMASDPSSPHGAQSSNETSTWGGQHVQMEVTKDGATLDFDCATGTITQALPVDAQGKFKVSGTFTRERPGPTTPGGNTALAATYSGSIEGDTMHLQIVVEPDKESMGDYVLVRGKPGRLMRCK